jgi:hypothetical protein
MVGEKTMPELSVSIIGVLLLGSIVLGRIIRLRWKTWRFNRKVRKLEIFHGGFLWNQLQDSVVVVEKNKEIWIRWSGEPYLYDPERLWWFPTPRGMKAVLKGTNLHGRTSVQKALDHELAYLSGFTQESVGRKAWKVAASRLFAKDARLFVPGYTALSPDEATHLRRFVGLGVRGLYWEDLTKSV